MGWEERSLCRVSRCFGSVWACLRLENFLLCSGEGAESRFCCGWTPAGPHLLSYQIGIITVLYLVVLIRDTVPCRCQVHRFSEGVAGPCPPALWGLLSSGTALAVRGDLGVLPRWSLHASASALPWRLVNLGCLGCRARPRPGPVTAASGSFGFVCF